MLGRCMGTKRWRDSGILPAIPEGQGGTYGPTRRPRPPNVSEMLYISRSLNCDLHLIPHKRSGALLAKFSSGVVALATASPAFQSTASTSMFETRRMADRAGKVGEVECLVPDMSGIARGKILPATKFIKSTREHSLRLPESIFIQTVTGEYAEDEDDESDGAAGPRRQPAAGPRIPSASCRGTTSRRPR